MLPAIMEDVSVREVTQEMDINVQVSSKLSVHGYNRNIDTRLIINLKDVYDVFPFKFWHDGNIWSTQPTKYRLLSWLDIISSKCDVIHRNVGVEMAENDFFVTYLLTG